jgi:heme-degrading monooxygenase HmoA
MQHNAEVGLFTRPSNIKAKWICYMKGEQMAVKILIKRIVPENKAKEMIPLFRQMRILATNQSGYISGETLKSLDKPDTFLVISTWKSSDYWEKWLLSKERQETQDKIDALLGGKTEYEMFHYGFGE